MTPLIRRGMLVAALIVAAACKPKPQPAPSDTTVTVQPDTMDSVGTDSILLDQEGLLPEFEDEPELTADDTLLTKDDSTFIAERRQRREATRAGMPAGASLYHPDKWCTSGINATTANSAPGIVAGVVRKASECGMSVVIVPPRRLFTSNGENQGPFVKAKYFAMIDDYARVLTPAFVGQYGPKGNRTIISFQVFDDSKCAPCWAGNIIPSSTVAELARYAKAKLPHLPRGVRIEPSLLLDYRGWQNGDLDYTVEQWTTKKRPPRYLPVNGSVAQMKAWYRYQDSLARVVTKNKMHMRQVSLGDITPPDGPDITVNQLNDYYKTAISYDPSNNCANVSWKWENFFGSGGYRTVWQEIGSIARGILWRSCAGTTDVGAGDSVPTDTVVVLQPPETAVTAAPETATAGHGRKPKKRS